MSAEPDEHFARRHGYTIVSERRGWRVLGPRERARCRIDGEYLPNANEAWRVAARRIRRALASQRVKERL